MLVAGAALSARPAPRGGATSIRVGSKNFTEQIVLGEIARADARARSGVTVERRLNLGGTFICDRALRSGDIDVYVEYTGTADTAVFKEPVETDPGRVLERVRRRYAEGGEIHGSVPACVPPLSAASRTTAAIVVGSDA